MSCPTRPPSPAERHVTRGRPPPPCVMFHVPALPHLTSRYTWLGPSSKGQLLVTTRYFFPRRLPWPRVRCRCAVLCNGLIAPRSTRDDLKGNSDARKRCSGSGSEVLLHDPFFTLFIIIIILLRNGAGLPARRGNLWRAARRFWSSRSVSCLRHFLKIWTFLPHHMAPT